MLTELRVRDLAVIADATLPLEPGLNVLTGETGAGKSILVDALALLLGERASADLVRAGARRAVVEAAFDLRATTEVAAAADDAGVHIDEDMLIVRRDINAEGRNRAWANGSPTTVGVLASLGRSLVDLHGQHESQSLLRAATQRDILDAFGSAGAERRAVTEAFRHAAELRERESELVARRDEVRRRADYLRHVVSEIEDADPQPGEDEALATEAKRLANAEELVRTAERLADLLDGEGEGNVASALGQARKILEQLERVDDSVAAWTETLEAAAAGVDELARSARDYASDIEADPGRLAEVEARRDLLYRLLHKYGPTLDELLATASDARRELDLLDTADLDLERLAEERAAAEEALAEVAAGLSATRRGAAQALSGAVQELLPSLGMPGARFRPDVTALERIGAHGADAVSFVVQLNPGLDARPLAQVASGGELSRLMLALKVVLARHDVVQTLVFDEVDQGIGGETGAKVADALAAVAGTHQVLVITHLPQIAGRADHHVRITKSADGAIATANVETLRGEDRVMELARMLGDSADPALQRHARDLLGRTPEERPPSRSRRPATR